MAVLFASCETETFTPGEVTFSEERELEGIMTLGNSRAFYSKYVSPGFTPCLRCFNDTAYYVKNYFDRVLPNVFCGEMVDHGDTVRVIGRTGATYDYQKKLYYIVDITTVLEVKPGPYHEYFEW